ncbi:MAG: hypothetical protein ABL962_17180 [Fimbriimonadaceae bacterium]
MAKSILPLEHEVQASIKQALEWANFSVDHTSAFLQKGSSGVSRGIPDLLISCRLYPHTYFGIEVKRDATKPVWSSAEQMTAAFEDRFIVVDNPTDALRGLRDWVLRMGGEPRAQGRLLAGIDRVLKGLEGK